MQSATKILVSPVLSLVLSAGVFANATAHAAPDGPFVFNEGLTDAWFNPAADGQGFFITVYPDIRQVFLAWFTYDTERPPTDAPVNLGDAGHRWLTAQGGYDGDSAELTIFLTRGGVFDAPDPAAGTDLEGDGTLRLEFADCRQGMATYEISSLGLSGEIPIQRITGSNVARCEQLWAERVQACARPEPDPSHGPDNPTVTNAHIVDELKLVDGGPGPDGIPPLETPAFIEHPALSAESASELVVGVKIGDEVRAYPYNILYWHEIVNDRFTIDGVTRRATISYCPLTGSAVLWKPFNEAADQTFGTSGVLYNSNLVLYDRSTKTLWSQMLEQGVRGSRVTWIPERLQVVETTWGNWLAMYPETKLLSRNTGFSRDYDDYPYGSFREESWLLFEVDNMDDTRLHRKARVLGINVGESSKVYPLRQFAADVEIINENVGGMDVVVAGSSGHDFGVVYNRELEDCTVLDFEPVQGRLPVVMRDTEGNEWDIFGTALSGPRSGQQLQKTNSYIAYFYAWTAFFNDPVIHGE